MISSFQLNLSAGEVHWHNWTLHIVNYLYLAYFGNSCSVQSNCIQVCL